jgi:hypothetical protein
MQPERFQELRNWLLQAEESRQGQIRAANCKKDSNVRAEAGCSENVSKKKRGTELATIYESYQRRDYIALVCLLI